MVSVKSTGRKRIWIISLVVIVFVAILLVVKSYGKQEGYRTIKVFEVSGKVGVVNKGIEYEAYPGMILTEGYSIVTSANSYVRLVLDGDKYIKISAGSKVTFEKLGMMGSGKTTINLERGAVLSEIVHALKIDEEFIINTPNIVLAVRGTMFKVEVNADKEGCKNTNVLTYGGAVSGKRIEPDGNVIEEQVVIEAGYKTTVRMDDDETIYVVEETDGDETEKNTESIDVTDITNDDMVDIYFASKNGHEMFVPTEELEEEIEQRGIDISQETSVYRKADKIEQGKQVTSVDDSKQLVSAVEKEDIGDGTLSDGGHRHKYIESVTEATCLEEGHVLEYCEGCGDVRREEKIPATGHMHEVYGGTEDSHTECEDCGTVLSREHSYREEVIGDEFGGGSVLIEYICDCGYSYMESTGGEEHTKSDPNASVTTCSKCGTKLVDFDSNNFPDDVFLELLKADGIDTNEDGLLEESELEAVKSISFHDEGIKDVTGLEYFTELTYLDLSSCSNVTSINLDNNKNLKNIQLQSTGIRDLILDEYTKLEEVCLTGCNMEEVRITNCTKLVTLDCPDRLSTLDITGCTSLSEVDLSKLNSSLYSIEVDGSGLRGELNLYGFTMVQVVSANNCKYLDGINVVDCYTLTVLTVKESSVLYINADNCFALNFPEVEENTYEVDADVASVDFSQLEGFRWDKVTVISGGTFDGDVFTFDEGSTMIVYNYYLENMCYGQFIIKRG